MRKKNGIISLTLMLIGIGFYSLTSCQKKSALYQRDNDAISTEANNHDVNEVVVPKEPVFLATFKSIDIRSENGAVTKGTFVVEDLVMHIEGADRQNVTSGGSFVAPVTGTYNISFETCGYNYDFFPHADLYLLGERYFLTPTPNTTNLDQIINNTVDMVNNIQQLAAQGQESNNVDLRISRILDNIPNAIANAGNFIANLFGKPYGGYWYKYGIPCGADFYNRKVQLQKGQKYDVAIQACKGCKNWNTGAIGETAASIQFKPVITLVEVVK